MDNTIVSALIGVIGVLFGTWIGGKVSIKASRDAAESSNRNAINIIRIQEFNKAAADFRAAFAPAIAKFKIISDINEIKKMLWDELIPMSVAIEKFRPFVCPSRRDEYQETWEKYHQSHKRDGVSSIYFLDYIINDEHKRFSLFNSRITDILKFTEN